MPSLYFLLCSALLNQYAKRQKPSKQRELMGYGKYVFILSVFLMLIVFLFGLDVENPPLLALLGLSVVGLTLVYFDGKMTEKVVGKDLAVECNPMAKWMFKKVGFRFVRVSFWLFVCGVVAYSLVMADIHSLLSICLMWIIVDSSNLMVWRNIKKMLRLKSMVIVDEIGMEDIHEL